MTATGYETTITQFDGPNSVSDIYINDIADGLLPATKLFADDTSFFFVTHYVNTTVNKLNNDLAQRHRNINDLEKNSNRTQLWTFNFDPSTQAQEARHSGLHLKYLLQMQEI